jgi:hypothetical protein
MDQDPPGYGARDKVRGRPHSFVEAQARVERPAPRDLEGEVVLVLPGHLTHEGRALVSFQGEQVVPVR